jgi:predicted O-methyltransferase YrrM
MDFIDESLQRYVDNHTEEEPLLLQRINRETHKEVLRPRMLSGHFQGRVLSLFSNMIKPKSVLEIGTYTGYSALALAEGLSEDGKITTIDKNEELESRVRRYFDEAGLTKKITYIIGDALNVIPELEETFDLVFIDADKKNYGNYYQLVFDNVISGGYFLIDNVLWSGKVLSATDEKIDKDTRAILDFNEQVHMDHRVQNVLLPIRDGLMILRKL